jgi:hypothetical protein
MKKIEVSSAQIGALTKSLFLIEMIKLNEWFAHRKKIKETEIEKVLVVAKKQTTKIWVNKPINFFQDF